MGYVNFCYVRNTTKTEQVRAWCVEKAVDLKVSSEDVVAVAAAIEKYITSTNN